MSFSNAVEVIRVLSYASLFLFCLFICLKRRRFAVRTACVGISLGAFLVFLEIVYAACLLSGEPDVRACGIKQSFAYDVYAIFTIVKMPLLFAGCMVFSAAGLYFTKSFIGAHHLAEQPVTSRSRIFSRRIFRNTRSCVPVALLVATLMLVYTWILFSLTHPRPHQTFNDEFLAILFGGNCKTLSLAAYAISAAAWEEIVFRMAAFGGFLWVFTRRTGLALCARRSSVVLLCAGLSSLLWTLGHMGMIVPEWIKLAQVFPMGVALALVYLRYGLFSSVVVHVIFNLGVVFVVGPLLF